MPWSKIGFRVALCTAPMALHCQTSHAAPSGVVPEVRHLRKLDSNEIGRVIIGRTVAVDMKAARLRPFATYQRFLRHGVVLIKGDGGPLSARYYIADGRVCVTAKDTVTLCDFLYTKDGRFYMGNYLEGRPIEPVIVF